MQANGLRSPFQKGSGLYHFARMLKRFAFIKPDDCRKSIIPTSGYVQDWMDTYAVSSASNTPTCAREFGKAAAMRTLPNGASRGGYAQNKMQMRIWNEFARKFGWNDVAAKFLARIKQEDGLEHRTDIITAFELIDLREGRDGESPSAT